MIEAKFDAPKIIFFRGTIGRRNWRLLSDSLASISCGCFEKLGK